MAQLIFRIISDFPFDPETSLRSWIITRVEEGDPPKIFMELLEDAQISAEVDLTSMVIRVTRNQEGTL